MVNQTTSIDVSDNQSTYQQTIIGDLLLHTESKVTTIPIIIRLISPISTKVEQPPIQRFSPSNSKTNGTQTVVPFDLKNTPPMKRTQERIKTSSSKKLLRMHKAGLTLMKEFKSKVKTSHTQSTNHQNDTNADDDDDNVDAEHTQL